MGSKSHLVKECPKKKRESYKKNKKKQTMVAKWSDFEGSTEPESEDGQAQLCLMANDDKDDDLDQNHKEVLDFLNSCSKDELVKALFDMFQIEKILKDEKNIIESGIRHYAEGCEALIKKNESLKAETVKFEKTVKVLKEQNLSQTKQLIDLKNKNNDLESKLKTLYAKKDSMINVV